MRGDWIAFIDDDCVPAPDWLTQLEAHLQKNPNAVVGGDVLNGLPDDPYAEATQVMMKQLYMYYHTGQRQRTQHPYFATNNFALSKRVFDQVGEFYEPMRLGEDSDLSARLGWRDSLWSMRPKRGCITIARRTCVAFGVNMPSTATPRIGIINGAPQAAQTIFASSRSGFIKGSSPLPGARRMVGRRRASLS